MLIFIISLVLTTITAFIQGTNWILLGPLIKPNLILTVLLVLALINPNWMKRAALIATALVILKFAPGFDPSDLIFAGALTISIIMLDLLPWRPPINLLVATLTGTIIINSAQLVLLPLLYELVFNLLLVFIFSTLLKLIHVPQIKLQRNRF